jgi:hypothetical protein
VRPLLNVKRSPKSPVVLLYEIPHVAESEVREILELNAVQSVPVRRPVEVALAFQIAIVTFGQTVEFVPFVIVIEGFVVDIDPNVRADCLELNVFQSVRESAPVVVVDASPIERPVPTRESQFVGVRIERTPCLLLNVVQSVPVSTPVEEDDAFHIENTPVRLLYERGPTAERAVSPILVATTHESEARLAFVRARLPERVFTFPERILTVVVRVVRLPERVAIFVVLVAVCHERATTLPESVLTVVVRFVTFVFVVARLPERVTKFHERVAILPVAVARFALVVARDPERVVTLELRPPRDPESVARLPESVEILVVLVAVCPERVTRLPESVAILPVAVARLVERVAIFPVAVARPIVRLLILTSCAVLLPWSFWNAWRMESEAATVPEPAMNPVRGAAIARALVK